jgi:hypothetical protein
MTAISQLESIEEIPDWKSGHVSKIIEVLAGGKRSFRVEIHQLGLMIGDKRLDIDGQMELVLLGKDEEMQLETTSKEPHNAASTSDSGRALFYTGDLEVLRINAAGKRLDLDIEDKDFIKRIMRLRDEFTPRNSASPENEEKEKKSSPLGMIRTIAETMQKLGITLTISYKGRRVATIGAEAHPVVLQIITKTRTISINSLYTALEMMI